MAIVNAGKVDTNPGHDAVCPFSPPNGWEGDSNAYMTLMRTRYRDLMHRQRMNVTASFATKQQVTIIGPFSAEAERIISSMKTPSAKLPKSLA